MAQEEDGEFFKKILRFHETIVGEDKINLLPYYFQVCLILTSTLKVTTSSNLLSDLMGLTRNCIENICENTADLFSVEVSANTLSVKSKLKFNQSDFDDEIRDKAKVIEFGLRLVYAIGATNEVVLSELERHDTEKFPLSMEQISVILSKLDVVDGSVPFLDRLGFVLLRVILCNSTIDLVTSLQHQCFCVLMFASKLKNKEAFSNFLLERGVVKKIVETLDSFLKPRNLDIKKRISRNDNILPILIVLNNLVGESESVKAELESMFYPFELPEPDFTSMSEEEVKIAERNRTMRGTTPENSLGGRMNELMTELDENVKRLSAELVWNICDEEQDKFVRRAGYGNGVHLLAIKGGMLEQMMNQQQK